VKTIDSIQGAFGEIKIVETPLARRMIIADTVQGGCYNAPDANAYFFGNMPLGPGPVTESPYQLAWLMAGCRNPRAKALMLGMGCGSGAICLLYHFPDLTLDIVEADPLVVDMAQRYFPLVRHYQQQQRMRIIVADAYQAPIALDAVYDFVIIDLAFDQMIKDKLDNLDELIESMASKTTEVWLNTIDSIDSNSFIRLVYSFASAGMSAAYAMSPISPDDWLPIRRNWIITTNDSLHQAKEFNPYAGIETQGARTARKAWQALLGSRTSIAGIGHTDKNIGG
jgi:hypothetical protein